MMHALPWGAGSPRYKVMHDALYRDWPAAHTALLELYVFNRADIDRVVDVLRRGYPGVPDEPDPAEAGGDGGRGRQPRRRGLRLRARDQADGTARGGGTAGPGRLIEVCRTPEAAATSPRPAAARPPA
jgi:hypothetical protein